jgi:hypothetical protein
LRPIKKHFHHPDLQFQDRKVVKGTSKNWLIGDDTSHFSGLRLRQEEGFIMRFIEKTPTCPRPAKREVSSPFEIGINRGALKADFYPTDIIFP